MNTNEKFLRLALKLDAVASGAIAVASLAFSKPMEEWFGTAPALSLGVGAFLAVYATGVWVLASMKTLSHLGVWTVIIGNLGWVVASAVFAFSGLAELTTLGTVYVMIQAAGVLLFADLEFLGLRKTRTA